MLFFLFQIQLLPNRHIFLELVPLLSLLVLVVTLHIHLWYDHIFCNIFLKLILHLLLPFLLLMILLLCSVAPALLCILLYIHLLFFLIYKYLFLVCFHFFCFALLLNMLYFQRISFNFCNFS